MTKINQEEYEVLKGLDDKWKWIARDAKGIDYFFSDEVHLYVSKPKKDERLWRDGLGGQRVDEKLFQFIEWEDEEPYNIKELIEGFEEAVRVNKIFENSTKMALEESEET